MVPPKLPARHPYWAAHSILSSLPITKEDGKSALVSLLETGLKRRDPHHNENKEHLIQFTLDWSPSYEFMLLSDCPPWACSQLSFDILFCDPLYKTRPTGHVYFGCVSAARPPSGCFSFGLSVDQHITTASNSQCTLILFDFFNFCFSQAAGSVLWLHSVVSAFHLCDVSHEMCWKWPTLACSRYAEKNANLVIFSSCVQKCYCKPKRANQHSCKMSELSTITL